jgi:hypothetical protein
MTSTAERIAALDAVEPVLGPLDTGSARQLRLAEKLGIMWGDLEYELPMEKVPELSPLQKLKEQLADVEADLKRTVQGRWKLAKKADELRAQIAHMTPMKKRQRPDAPGAPKKNMWAAFDDEE